MESHPELENWHFAGKMSEQNVLTTLKLKKYGIEEQVKTVLQLAKFYYPKRKCFGNKTKQNKNKKPTCLRAGYVFYVLFRDTQAF